MKIIKKSGIRASNNAAKKRYVRAAEFDDEFDDIEDDEAISDAVDDVQENIEDLQDMVDDVEEDGVEIAVNNNIADHFIAECSGCNGVFISAVVDSDQEIEFVSGVCPLCGKETDQYLKWVIKAVE